MPSLPPEPVLAVVGCTGAVGRELLAVLEERAFPHRRLRCMASPRSAGGTIEFAGTPIPIEDLAAADFDGVDLALFAAGSSASRQHADRAVAAGCTVIDNSSAFRLRPDVPLVVPEVNADVLDALDGSAIIANPNCSTIIALVAVAPLHRAAGIARMVVSTYQAASGAGAAWMAELEQQARDHAAGRPYTTTVTGRPYLFNCFSHNSPIGDDGYNEEETKLRRETWKIVGDDSIAVSATCVRVPVLRAHCEAITLTLRRPLDESAARAVLDAAPGVRVVDDRAANRFPEPRDASGGDDVLVGRIRADSSQPAGAGLALFVAGDQLRKGAALNAVQIAERLLRPVATTADT